MAILNNSNAISSGGYDINNSLRLRRSNNAYLSRTPAGAGNQQTWTYSAWVKRGLLGSIQDIWHANGSGTSENDYFAFDNNTLQFRIKNSNTVVCELITTQVFRDPSAWYHIVLAWDSTQATSSNRVKIYVNGTQITAFTTATYPAQNTNTNSYNSTVLHTIGTQWYSSTLSNYYDGYITEVNFVNAQALTPSSFGETDTTTGSWKPKAYTGTYGTNGFYLKFSDIATTSGSNAGLGKDFSGNGNYWTTNNISVTAGTTYDAMTDSPTLTSATVSNYPTLNATAPYGSSLTLSEGNLRTTCAGAYWAALPATFLIPTTGKWYWEVKAVVATNMPYDSNLSIGITRNISSQYNTGQDQWAGYTADSYGVTNDVSSMYKWTSATPTAYGASYTINDVIGVGLDMDAGTLIYYKNGVSQGTAFTGLTGNFVPSLGVNNTGTSAVINFGQRPFAYTPPSGYVALNTYNLPDSTIKKGNTVMDATLYTGNGSTQTITNAAGFKPDFLWIKSRSNTYSNVLNDSVRGVTKYLFSDLTSAETTVTDAVTSFNSNGFNLNLNAAVNGSTYTYVGWQWQAGQGSTSSNTSGSITSTVSVNTTAGFSVVTYTGTGANATVGHGLGVAPKMLLIKKRSGADGWAVGHSSLSSYASVLQINSTAAAFTDTSFFNSTAPTSSVFSVGSGGNTNASAATYVAYCWAEIAGYSKFGSYTGNGSTDGPFVYTGFRPKFVMIRNPSIAANWAIFDTSRDTYNVTYKFVFANSLSAESSSGDVQFDLTSNGFKVRQTSTNINGNGNTLIYMAFAENPFKNALAR